MANYGATGKTALNMECPHCEAYGEHKMEKTDPHHYRWTDEATPLLKRISGKDISFRQRTKRCFKCKRTFIAIELSKHYVRDLIGAALRTEGEVKALRESYKLSKKRNEVLKSKLQEIHSLSLPEQKKI